MKACAIVQARMSSTRLPGKVLTDLAGRPLIWHVVHRLRRCASLQQIIVATTDQESDDPLAAYLADQGIEVVRGPLENVLQRFALALEKTDADLLVRITGDSPLIDPGFVDGMLMQLARSGADYVRPSRPVSDCGIDPLTRSTLHRLLNEVGDDPVAREHVTGYFQVHPDFARCVSFDPGEGRHIEGARFSIDTPADLQFFTEIYRQMGCPAGEADFLEVLDFIRRQPDLLSINRHVRQRTASEGQRCIVIRCDGGFHLGMGHVTRCLAIADFLRADFSCAVVFAMRPDERAVTIVRDQGFPVQLIGETRPAISLADIAATAGASAVLLDIRTPNDPEECRLLRQAGLVVAVLDDPGLRRFDGDLAFYPPTRSDMDWSSFQGQLFAGWEWIPLRRQFASAPPHRAVQPPIALVTAGGSDPAGLTLRLTRAALAALPDHWRIIVVQGPAASKEMMADPLFGDSRIEIRANVTDMAALMSEVSLALCSFGMTAFELAVIGVPALHLCLTDDHLLSARAFSAAGMASVPGIHDQVSDGVLEQEIARLSRSSDLLARQSVTARSLVDGRGAWRIADKLVNFNPLDSKVSA